MNLTIFLLFVVLIIATICFCYCRYRRKQKLDNTCACLEWIDSQSRTVKSRFYQLCVITGVLAIRVLDAINALERFKTDLAVTQLEQALDGNSTDLVVLDEQLQHSLNELVRAKGELERVSQVLLHELAVETQRKTFSRVKNMEARHKFWHELDRFGQSMHRASVLVDEIDQELAQYSFSTKD